MTTIKLDNGVQIPQIGFGTWRITDRDICIASVKSAIEAGYRHIDTAQIYGNEEMVGEAIEQSGISRDQLFITTKLWNENQFFDHLVPSFEESLAKLKTDYIDLFLVHFPVTETRRPAWHKMEEIYESGKAKAIGVSNYTIKHLEELLRECKIKPAVNQVEIHVFLQQPELIDYCNKNGIVVEAYSPLAHGNGLDDAKLKAIAKKHGKTTSQIMIRWCVQKNLVVLPKSVNADRIRENIDVYDFELDDQDMKDIASLDRDYRTCWDPTNVS